MQEELLAKVNEVRLELERVISGKPEVVTMLLTALLVEGNVLMDDVPGVGKTTLAKALSRTVDGEFKRIQFTPDLLPADILGTSIYNPKTNDFVFHKGPVFANIVLADEINRASPRTQSALLEAMNEKQVSIDGMKYKLPSPFVVIATQNPIEYYGTYPLPEAQLDRFAIRLQMGYPDEAAERSLLDARRVDDPLERVQKRISREELVLLQGAIREIEVESSLEEYMLRVIRATRTDERISLGASPRALLTLFRCSQAYAFLSGRDYVTPDDVKSLFDPVLSHRIVPDLKAKHSGVNASRLLREILERTACPV